MLDRFRQSMQAVLAFILGTLAVTGHPTTASSGTVTIRVDCWNSASRGCTGCGLVNQYTCTSEPEWTSQCAFVDPLPASSCLTKAVAVIKAEHCGPKTTVRTAINLDEIGRTTVNVGRCPCAADACVSPPPTMTGEHEYPGYQYGAQNNFKLLASGGSLCVRHVELSLTFEPLEGGNGLYSVEVEAQKPEVWPQLVTVQLRGISSTIVRATLDPCGPLTPKEGLTVEWQATWRPGSGGHAHGGAAPVGEFEPPTCVTDADGACDVKWTAPFNSGAFEFRARVAGAMDWSQPATVTARVPGLVELPAGPTWVLVPASPAHPAGHFRSARANIECYCSAIAALGLGRTWVNDIALETGGLFDITGRWVAPHLEHRLGLQADVDDFTFEGNRVDHDTCLQVMQACGDVPTDDRCELHNNNHYHLRWSLNY